MKKIIIINCFLGLIVTQSFGQVEWNFTAKKSGDNKFEIHLTSIIQPGWHAFSQTQPEDALANPTEIVFNKNPLVELSGKTTELGKMEKYHDATLGVTQYQYSGGVDFVQEIKLKGKVKTNISGTITYQACNDEKCLPPKVVQFSVRLE